MTPPDIAPDMMPSASPTGSQAGPEPELLHEADGSMWSSLLSNVRDAFVTTKQAPLQLTSQPTSQDMIIREEPIWSSLAGSFRDVFFPAKLPPLVLTSTPIPVKDLLAEKRRPLPIFLSIATYAVLAGIFALLLYEARIHARAIIAKKPDVTNVDLKAYVPITPKAKLEMGGGGGGGDRSLVQVSKGALPKFSTKQIVPPQILKVDNPKLAAEPTIIMPKVKLPDANMPNIGLPSSTQVAMASNGTGTGGGMGSGIRGGLGSGTGNGFGPGDGGGVGGGHYRAGVGGVSAPQVIYSVEPEFSDEARRAKYEGICNVTLIVDAQGNPQDVRVPQHLGMGLDEEAIKAVKQYKFKPAMYQGHPVPVPISVEVNFRIY
ncbi:MAG TPA: energy transducer TonB [Acidisarcina sp.]